MKPDALALRYFLAVAEERNFTHAAALLGIAQPALSAHIRRLEESLGVKVLERTTRHVDLTPAGRVLAERGPALLHALDALWEQVRRVGSGETGRLVLLFSPSVGSETVPVLVRGLIEQLSEVRVETKLTATPAIGPAVVRGDADAGLTRWAQSAPGTHDVLVRRETGGALVSTSHPLARKLRVTLSEVASYPVILHSRASNPAHHDAVVQLFADAGLAPEFVQPPMSYDVSQSIVRTTQAVGLVGQSAVKVALPGTKWIPLRESAAAVLTYLVLPAGKLTEAQSRLRTAATMIARAHDWIPAASETDIEAHTDLG